MGNVVISDHWGKPKPFSSDFLVTENQKSTTNAAIFLNFLKEIKDQVLQFDVFINAFTLSHLNGVSSRIFLNHINK